MSIPIRTIRLAAVVCALASSIVVKAQETGSIAGRVLDTSNGRPVSGASVVVVGLDDAKTQSDVDGKFGISEIPVGTYEVRVTSVMYSSQVIGGVVIEAGRQTSVQSTITPKADAGVEVLEVSADITESSEATQFLKRKMAATVSDNLGAESISKTPDSDAAEVVTRVPSVTIKDGSFLVVRGLGDRYNSALMNNSRMPSTDPTRRVVPLDLFPADFIESLSLVKSYTPDLPGDFAGGLLDIRLADPPLEPEMSAGISMGLNTNTTFQNFNTYDGCGAEDWFGFGTHCRELPSDFPSKQQIQTNNSQGTDLQQRLVAAQFPLNWDLERETAPPNFGIDVGMGDTWGPVGVNLAATYGTKHQYLNRDLGNFKNDSVFEDVTNDPFDYDESTFSTNLGAILTSVYRVNRDHRINLRFLYNRQSEDQTRFGSGYDENQATAIESTSAIYTADQLLFGQLSTQHQLGVTTLDLSAALGYTTRDQPDAKFSGRQFEEDEGGFIFNERQVNRYFTELDETLQEYATDLSIPVNMSIPFIERWAGTGLLFKTGASYLFRDRDFKARVFGYQDRGALSHFDVTTVTADEYFNPVNFGSDGIDLIDVTTRESERFLASQEVIAGYLMADVPLIAEKLRLIAGARFEYSYIAVTGAVLISDEPLERRINDSDILPAANLVYSLTDKMNLRAAYSRTVSRPEFRELNLALLPTAPGERAFRGNPDLESSKIQNFDLRWEWFPSPVETVSISAFYKDLTTPIEVSAVPAATSVIETRTNAEKATAWGIELETRRNFNFLIPRLRQWEPIRPYISFLADVEFVLNVTFVESEAKGLRSVRGFDVLATNPTRALTDQAPFVINTALQYDHFRWGTFRLLYNTVGETIVAAGTTFGESRLEDIKQQRRDQLDFVWLREWEVLGRNLKTKVSVENITNDDYLETQEVTRVVGDTVESLGTSITEQYYEGVTFGFSLTYNF